MLWKILSEISGAWSGITGGGSELREAVKPAAGGVPPRCHPTGVRAENAAFSAVYFGGRLPGGPGRPFKRGAMLGKNFDFKKNLLENGQKMAILTVCPKTHFANFAPTHLRPFFANLQKCKIDKIQNFVSRGPGRIFVSGIACAFFLRKKNIQKRLLFNFKRLALLKRKIFYM